MVIAMSASRASSLVAPKKEEVRMAKEPIELEIFNDYV